MSAKKLGLSELEIAQLKTISEFVFFDQFKDYATYPRFEQCFQPLFNETNISLDSIFKEIVGPKKKYITFPRLVNSYKKSKLEPNNVSNDLKIFFYKLLNEILVKENCSRGESPEMCFKYSTIRANQQRGYISLIEVLTDDDGTIHGLNVKYDEIFNNRMYPSKIEENLSVSLEMNLGIIDEEPIIKGSIGKFMGLKEKFFRDLVTHVFGTFDKEKKILSFLGFKCASGKTVFVGMPKGEGFLFGNFGTKLAHFKLEMTVDGITKLEPIFDENIRPNFYLKHKANELTEQDLSKDECLKDESEIAKLTNEDEIDKFIMTPIIEDDKFFNKKLQDIISGNDYKEVVNQSKRKWIENKEGGGKKPHQGPGRPRLPTLNDALALFEKEKKRRGNQQINFIGFGPHSKMPKGGLSQSFLQHNKKRLNFFKGPRGNMPRMFGPKGIDGRAFAETLAGFGFPFMKKNGKKQKFPQQKNQNFIMPHGHEQNENMEIPHPLCPDCKKLFGLVSDGNENEDQEKLRYYGGGYNKKYNNNYNYDNNYNKKYNNYGYNYNNYNYRYNYNYGYNYNNNYYPSGNNNRYYYSEETNKE